ncbi:hypothetical protein BH20CHL6_BH20CHL6_03380 [soil metagenome]
MGNRVPIRALIVTLAPFGAALIGLVAFQVVVAPDPQQRPLVAAVFLGMGALTALASWILPRVTARLSSLRRTVLLVAVVAMATTATAVAVSATFFMLRPAESRVLVVLLAFGVALGLLLEAAVARALTVDLRMLLGTARRIAAGDLAARTGLVRSDELGQAARAIDSMAAQLAEVDVEQTRRIAARETFLAAIGHDLRTPLAALQAAVEAVEDGLVPDPDRYFTAIHRNLEVIGGLVENLFLLARIQAGRLELPRTPVDLAELADEAVEALAPVARLREVRLRLETPGQVVVRGSGAELSRAIRNLMDNAIRHTAQGSEVRVEVREAEGALVRVVDEGPGFPEHVRERLRHGSTSQLAIAPRSGGGTGLGLIIAKGLIEAHGGRMWIEDGKGGRVAVLVPQDAGD